MGLPSYFEVDFLPMPPKFAPGKLVFPVSLPLETQSPALIIDSIPLYLLSRRKRRRTEVWMDEKQTKTKTKKHVKLLNKMLMRMFGLEEISSSGVTYGVVRRQHIYCKQ